VLSQIEMMERMSSLTNNLIAVAHWMSIGFVVSTAIGCSNSRPPVYPAGGIVKLADGTLLSGGSVTFLPEDGEQRISARGQVGADGRFALSTFSAGDGAIVGRHRAIVSSPLGGDRESPDASTLRLDPRFANYETSGLTFVVSADPAKNEFEIVVDRAP
jgi:hypothetical protein